MLNFTLTIFFIFFLGINVFCQGKYHRAKVVCDYYSGSLVINNTSKLNIFGLSNELNVGSLYFLESKYYIITEPYDYYEQDADDYLIVVYQPSSITNYNCKKYIELEKVGTYYSQASNNYCINNSFDKVTVNYYWTGNLQIGSAYLIENEYYKITSISNTSNQDADENWYGAHFITPIDLSCKRFHKLQYIGSSLNCNSFLEITKKWNLLNLDDKLVVSGVYKINNIYYRVLSSSDYQEQDANDDVFVNTIIGPYACRTITKEIIDINSIKNNNLEVFKINIYNIQGIKVKEYR